MIEKSPKKEIDSRAASGARTGAEKGSETRSRLFEVEIAGVPLRLKSPHDEATVNELVALVDRKIREALPLTKTGSIQNAAILASLHLAEEYLMLRHKAKNELERLEQRTNKVISELESSRVTGLNHGLKAEKLEKANAEHMADQLDEDISSEKIRHEVGSEFDV